ncbi:calmodulin-binding protein Sha1 [Histoplasma capsulatum var. duboisii H88]|uniref:Calmodulin-binding protein Sha1 n=1 Tax=Ajellomyces capsulatus (strain H88) TaxID=544711 RepID=F0UHS3_AJEC8|nr:calmodulin-binding protein Sha1 [Histoplasma capsulatum var. duboisii H88]QSS56904.1 calmodulin-binding protein Sha1 [Histoplasma capsulatum var. duboisii H88]
MSTGYDDVGTPCPTAWRRDSKLPFRNSTYISDFYDEFGLCEGDTAAIDFTADVRAPLTKVKPRKGGQAKAFSIHEDGLDNFGPVKGKPTEPSLRPKVKPICKSSSMFSQPAQRFQRPKVSFAALEAPKAEEPAVQRKSPPQPNKPPVISNHITKQKEEQPPVIAADPLKKSIRRRTIYIPSEDTTVPSVFMGIFSPIKNLNPLKGNDDITEASEIGSLESKIIRKRSARKSLSVAPRRAPLQPTLKPMQESSIKQDIPGQNGGKENMPPGGVTVSSTKHGKLKGADFPVFDVPHVEKRKNAGAVEPVKRTTSIVKPAMEAKPETRSNPPPANRKALGNTPSVTLNSKISLRGKNTSNPKTNVKAVPSQGSRPSRSSPVPKPSARGKPAVAQRAPTKLTGPKTLQLRVDQKYPLLSEDISNPAMYEENWLAHQEAAITQLVNALFDSARGNTGLYDSDTLRHELLGIYQAAPFSLLYKRIHASLLYGALGVPKDVLARGNGLKEDIGRKRTFLNFWIETYDLSALRAAAETVIGRRIPVPSRPSRLSDSKASVFPKEGRQLRRTLESFLETFILRNEDVGPTIASQDGEDVGTPRWSYRRTILRSIMIIVLLDKARSNSGTTLPRCLFNPSSKYKSSAAALQGLGAMLLPSVGDITRPLSHLDCRVYYKQHPLQEYDYRINNLAVDLRDGVLLTRLVELLLYPSASAILSQEPGPDATATALAMPTGEILSLVEGEEDWILSQHLKIPCIGRATKLFNVQIALGALAGVQGIGSIAQGIRAEDIVDGYREKTIALLWGLVGKWGLSALVDWDDVRKEIRRLELKAATCGVGSGSGRESEASSEEVEEEEEKKGEKADFDACYERHSFLLKKWASCLARLGGVRLDNLTTSFADGRIFGSIVDEYEGFIVGEEGRLNSSTSLDVRLRFLGCSSQFASLVTPSLSPSCVSSSHFFDQDFTLSALAFLCSRLLPASKRARAAIVLQSAWRRTHARRQLQKRIILGKIATECMEVVQERKRLLWAKGVIVRWWRNVGGNSGKKKCLIRKTGAASDKHPARKLAATAHPRNKAVSRRWSAKVAFAEDAELGQGQDGRLATGDLQPIEEDLWLDL